MAAHACLKNEFIEDEKYHNLMTWLKLFFPVLEKTDSFMISCMIASLIFA